MPSFTKNAIVESFLRIVGKKPLDKITVRDVVDDCGINRNTFYYYFRDIYAVLEEICHEVAEKLPENETLSATLTAFFRLLYDFAADHPRTVRSLILSLGHDGLERYFAADMDRVIFDCLLRESGERPCSRDYLRRLTAFVRHAVFGICTDALRNDRREDPEAMLCDLSRILDTLAASLHEKH
ncbi:MAG: TetR/AcrR family transcriptional regulator C-terminal domain-containing protein [Clostridia bacterium]|nr:TetR/AcrR family transcriptional regulator C-terminal domain-containing protein [Clostridia bacterium]